MIHSCFGIHQCFHTATLSSHQLFCSSLLRWLLWNLDWFLKKKKKKISMLIGQMWCCRVVEVKSRPLQNVPLWHIISDKVTERHLGGASDSRFWLRA